MVYSWSECAPTTFIVYRSADAFVLETRASRRHRRWARVCLRALDRFSRLENGSDGGGEFAIRTRAQGLAQKTRARLTLGQ